MKTVRRLLYRDIGGSVLFVAVAFLCLFFFIDFVDELSRQAKAPGAVEAGKSSTPCGLVDVADRVLPQQLAQLHGHLHRRLPARHLGRGRGELACGVAHEKLQFRQLWAYNRGL